MLADKWCLQTSTKSIKNKFKTDYMKLIHFKSQEVPIVQLFLSTSENIYNPIALSQNESKAYFCIGILHISISKFLEFDNLNAKVG